MNYQSSFFHFSMYLTFLHRGFFFAACQFSPATAVSPSCCCRFYDLTLKTLQGNNRCVEHSERNSSSAATFKLKKKQRGKKSPKCVKTYSGKGRQEIEQNLSFQISLYKPHDVLASKLTMVVLL